MMTDTPSGIHWGCLIKSPKAISSEDMQEVLNSIPDDRVPKDLKCIFPTIIGEKSYPLYATSITIEGSSHIPDSIAFVSDVISGIKNLGYTGVTSQMVMKEGHIFSE